MKEHSILSKLFSVGEDFSVCGGFGHEIKFLFPENQITDTGDKIILTNCRLEDTEIRYSEIKEIKVTDKTITFIMQDSGHNFKDGDKKVLRRKYKC